MSRRSSISPPPLKRRKAAVSRIENESADIADSDQISIYSWNINGIDPFVQSKITSFFRSRDSHEAMGERNTSSSTNLREVLRRNGWPTMLFLQEVKMKPEDEATRRAVERAVLPAAGEQSGQPSYKAFFCLPSDKHNARGFGRKVYGVCSIIRQDFLDHCVDKVREVEWDAEGRFLVCETKEYGMLPRLAIFNIYAVNGTDAPYKDPETGRVAGTRHNRKLQVHRLLRDECRSLCSKGVMVILAGDMNIARTPIDGYPNLRTFPMQHNLNRADFEAKFFARGTESANGGDVETHNVDDGLDFVDSFRHLHPDRRGYTYYPRGRPFGSSCDRVDMILVSRLLERHLVGADVLESVVDRGTSDHVPLYVRLSFELIRARDAKVSEAIGREAGLKLGE